MKFFLVSLLLVASLAEGAKKGDAGDENRRSGKTIAMTSPTVTPGAAATASKATRPPRADAEEVEGVAPEPELIEKLGAYVMQAGETSPVVWEGRTLLVQTVSGNTPGRYYPCCTWCGASIPSDWRCTAYANCSACSCSDDFRRAYGSCAPQFFELVDFATLEVVLSPIPGTYGFGYASAFVHGGALWVYGTNLVNNTRGRGAGGGEIVTFSSVDPLNPASWQRRTALTLPTGYNVFNTDVAAVDGGGDVTGAPSRRFIMAVETNAGPHRHPGFMSIFATTNATLPDRGWALVDPEEHSFTKERYSACPAVRWFGGFYYVATTIMGPPCPPSGTHGNYSGTLCVVLARSKTLREEDWVLGNGGRPILYPSELDRRVLPRWNATAEERAGIENGPLILGDINNSDFDFCDTEDGVLGILAGIANQQSNPYFNIATIAKGQNSAEWLASYFPEALSEETADSPRWRGDTLFWV